MATGISIGSSGNTIIRAARMDGDDNRFGFVARRFPDTRILRATIKGLRARVRAPCRTDKAIAHKSEGTRAVISRFRDTSLCAFAPASNGPISFDSSLRTTGRCFGRRPSTANAFAIVLSIRRCRVCSCACSLAIRRGDRPTGAVASTTIRGIGFGCRPNSTPRTATRMCGTSTSGCRVTCRY